MGGRSILWGLRGNHRLCFKDMAPTGVLSMGLLSVSELSLLFVLWTFTRRVSVVLLGLPPNPFAAGNFLTPISPAAGEGSQSPECQAALAAICNFLVVSESTPVTYFYGCRECCLFLCVHACMSMPCVHMETRGPCWLSFPVPR